MDKICRTCLRVINITEYKQFRSEDSKNTSQAFTTLKTIFADFDAEIVSDAILCNSCTTELRLISIFRDMCVYSDNRIKSYVRRLNVDRKLVNSDLLEVASHRLNGASRFDVDEGEQNEIVKLENSEQEEAIVSDLKYEIETVDELLLEVKQENEELNALIENDKDNAGQEKDESLLSNFCERKNSDKVSGRKELLEKAKINTYLQSSPEEEPFKCNICKGRFLLKGQLRKHVNKVHKSYKCAKCDKCFRLKIARVMHMRRIHNKEKYLSHNSCKKSKNYKPDKYVKSHLEGDLRNRRGSSLVKHNRKTTTGTQT